MAKVKSAQGARHEVLTPDEAAKELRLSRNAIYQAIAKGEVPSVRIGRKILVPRARLEAMLRGEKAA
jgi:excisionase family DNA binding protein